MQNDIRIMYLRDSYPVVDGMLTPGQPVGCLAIRLNKTGTRAEYGLSVLNPKDKFSREIGRSVASAQLSHNPFSVRIPSNATIHEITEAVMLDLESLPQVPSRARRAAKVWINTNGLGSF